MKTLRLILIVIGCGTLLQGPTYAESSTQEPRQKPAENSKGTVSDHPEAAKPAAAEGVEDFSAEAKLLHRTRGGGRLSNKTEKVNHSTITKAAPKQLAYHPEPLEKRLAGSHAKNTPGIAPAIYKPGSSKLPGAARTASKTILADKEKNHPVTLAAHSQGTVPLGGSTFSSLRGRNPEPGVVGGTSVSTARTTAAIGGTSFHNRTY
jgi:hypothetical protein